MDYVIVSEYNWGAMENVGCILINDQYITRDVPTTSLKARVCNTIFHELAHMWFGNLVTMKWWEDLWLNESFATFFSHYVQDKTLSSEFPDGLIWTKFLRYKNWGYRTDQLPSAHPISVEVKDTEQAETNFDGISYGKGSSVLKQLSYLIGDSAMQRGLQIYF